MPAHTESERQKGGGDDFTSMRNAAGVSPNAPQQMDSRMESNVMPEVKASPRDPEDGRRVSSTFGAGALV